MGQTEYMGKAKNVNRASVIKHHIKLLLGDNAYMEEKSILILEQNRMKVEIKAYTF
jgi:hypothetical protein